MKGVKKLTEAAFTRQVLALARATGWRSAHFLPGMNRRGEWRTPVQGDGKGFPDLVLVNPRPGRGRVLFVELKTDRGRLGAEQVDWQADLLRAGATARVWRPEDWPEIERTLKGE